MKSFSDAIQRGRCLSGFSVLLILLACTVALADSPVAPFYALPAPGAWIEFDCIDTSREGKETPFKLRISHTGEVERAGATHAWIEIKLTETRKGAEHWKLRKLLVSLPEYKLHGNLAKSLSGAYQQAGPGQEWKALPQAELDKLLYLGLPAAANLKLLEKTVLESPLGKLECTKYHASGKNMGRHLHYQAWRSEKVPFGLAKFTVDESTDGTRKVPLFRATASTSGTTVRNRATTKP